MLRSQIDAAHYRGMYANLEARADAGDTSAAEVKGVIDQAFAGVESAFKAWGYGADPCDAAEGLVGCITCYFIESNPSFRSLFAPLPGAG